MNINAKIAELILRAQNASNGGKGKTILVSGKKSYRDNRAGYRQKDNMIISAIELIRLNKTAFRFSVVEDRERIAYYIIYFETRIDNVKYQVSFHSYDSKNLEPYCNSNKMHLRWDKKISQESAISIYSHFVKNGRYL